MASCTNNYGKLNFISLLVFIMFLSFTKPASCVLSSSFTRSEGQVLLQHGFLNILVRNVWHCLAYCQRHPSCWSVNYEEAPGQGLCTLNDADHISYSHLMSTQPGNVYYRKVCF